MQAAFPIGVFDSGYGGLTVLKDIVKQLPMHDFIYLGDNARAPYGNRSFETVYQYTLECVNWFFKQQCPLVILACNTASAKALRSIQQIDLPKIAPDKKVLGVIRPSTEILGSFSETKHIGILATNGTIASGTYAIEMKKFFPEVTVLQQACPMWVPLVENNEHETKGAEFFIKKDLHALLAQSDKIDTVLLACTHFPLLKALIEPHLPVDTKLLTQGQLVAESLKDYLFRHQEIDSRCSKNGKVSFYTTDDTDTFNQRATIFYGEPLNTIRVDIQH